MKTPKIPTTWEAWCKRGVHSGARKKNAVLRSLKSGHVRGYFSDFVLNPDLDPTNSMYPSVEHLAGRNNHDEIVVEARIVNDMKSHLTEDEFWRVVEHLFSVGIEKGKITAPFGKRLPRKWSPEKHYTPKQANKASEATSETAPSAASEAPQV